MKSLLTTGLLVTLTFINVECSSPWNSVKGNGTMKTDTRTTQAYDKIDVSGSFDVELIEGTEGSITVDAEENLQEYIITEVNGNTLEIYTQNGVSINSHKGIHITVPVIDLDGVALTGSGSITAKQTLTATTFKASVTGSGNSKLTLNAEDIIANVTGSGSLTLKGSSHDVHADITGSGNLIAKDLQTNDADVTVQGSGDMLINCTENLKASVTGSGDIEYLGTPETRDFSTLGSGDITAK